jgi:outer membrane receptor protein involved in Fe transport
MPRVRTAIFRVLAMSSFGLLAVGNVQAQGATPESDQQETLEEIIVTGVAQPIARVKSSVSVSALGGDEVAELAPRSVAEVFRSLPGIRAESSGGGGNANITIRGIPLATGGSKYLQLHEDGLPVAEFGDINFANADNFIRYDGSIGRIESVRGGSASTFASNSPGGIINLISKTGGDDSGSVGVSFGVDYDELRTDFEYGGSLSDSIDFHVGGFYRQGEGVRHTGFDGDNGGQIKANVTRTLTNGHLRFFFKHLDDRVSTYLPSPLLVKSNGDFGPVPGYDASSETLYSAFQTNLSTFDAFGNRRQRDMTDGIESKVNSFGFEFQNDFGDGFSVTNRFRTSDITGGFISPFTDGVGTAGTLADGICAGSPADGAGTPVSGCTGTTVTLASGPNAGSVYSRAALAFNNLIFDTTFNDVGLLVNDLKVSKSLGSATITLGFYKSKQSIDIDWSSWPFYLQSVDGSNPQNLDVVSTTGEQIVQDGLYFPGLLSWNWDLHYDTTAPYLNVAFDLERFNLDLSVRRDSVEARGQRTAACCGRGAFGTDPRSGILADIDNDGSIDYWEARGVAIANNFATVNLVNYDADNTAFSLGGAFLLTENSSIFARYSEGGRAIADRLLQIGGTLNADGSLTSTTDGFDNVDQLEVGYKIRSENWAFYATYFDTTTEETNAEITSGLTFVREYDASGLELEGQWNAGLFGIRGNVTWTDAEITKDLNNAAVIGNVPRRQADLIYTLAPQFGNDRWAIGVALQGSSEYFTQDSNELRQDGYVIANAFGRFDVNEHFSVMFNINNLTDEFVVTEVEEGSAAPGSIVRGRPLSARSSSLSLRYRF